MKKGRAKQVQIIFITANPLLQDGLYVDRMTDAERATWDAVQDAAANVVQQNPAAQVFVLDMNRYRDLQSVQLERWGITKFPAVRLWAVYGDDSEASYNYTPTLPGTAPDLEKIYPSALALYQGEFGDNSPLCKLFPPLCKLGALAWLGLTVYAAYRATQAQGTAARAGWAAGAAVMGNEFLKRGGMDMITAGTKQLNENV